MSKFKINSITDKEGTSGPVIAGVSTNNSTGCMIIPAGPTEHRGGRGRGLFAGGNPSTNVIQFITISSAGNAEDFGDLTQARSAPATASSSTRGIRAGGNPNTDTMDYVTISEKGNAFDFGDLTEARRQFGGCSDGSRGVFFGGLISTPSSASSKTIDYVTISTIGNAVGFGDLIREAQANTAASDPTRGIVFGAYSQQNSASYNIIQYVTIATLGNAQDFGDLSVPRYAVASLSSVTRAITGGGYDATTYYNIIEYVTIQTFQGLAQTKVLD